VALKTRLGGTEPGFGSRAHPTRAFTILFGGLVLSSLGPPSGLDGQKALDDLLIMHYHYHVQYPRSSQNMNQTTSPPALEAENLSKHFGKTIALDSLSLSVAAGEVFCLLGSNGAGKTTTVNLFLNFLEPTEGCAKILGADVRSNPSLTRSKLTYLPEQVALYPELSGSENLQYLLSVSGKKAKTREATAEFLLQAGLKEDEHDELVAGYSKGMRQKVGIALALAKASEILLLDEPTSGLDPASANEFTHIVTQLAKRGAAVFMVTHDLYRAHQLSHRIGIMKKGVLVENRLTADLEAEELESLYLRHMRN